MRVPSKYTPVPPRVATHRQSPESLASAMASSKKAAQSSIHTRKMPARKSKDKAIKMKAETVNKKLQVQHRRQHDKTRANKKQIAKKPASKRVKEQKGPERLQKRLFNAPDLIEGSILDVTMSEDDDDDHTERLLPTYAADGEVIMWRTKYTPLNEEDRGRGLRVDAYVMRQTPQKGKKGKQSKRSKPLSSNEDIDGDTHMMSPDRPGKPSSKARSSNKLIMQYLPFEGEDELPVAPQTPIMAPGSSRSLGPTGTELDLRSPADCHCLSPAAVRKPLT